MKIQILISFLLIIGLISCQTKKNAPQPKRTVIAGKILDYEKYNKTKFLILQKNLFDHNDLKYEVPIDKEGSFKFELEQYEAEDFEFRKFSTYVFVAPGDSVYVTIDLNKLPVAQFSGDSKDYNEKLNRFYAEGYFGKGRDDKHTVASFEPEAFISLQDSLKKEHLSRLEKFKQDIKPSEALVTSLEGQIINNYYARLLEYGNSYCSILNEPKAQEIQLNEDFKYYSTIEASLEKEIHKAVKHASFNRVLNAYSLYIYRKINQPKIEAMKQMGQKYDYIQSLLEFEGNETLKDYMIYNSFWRDIKRNDLDVFEKHRSMLDQYIQSPVLLAKLESEYQKMKANKDHFLKPLKNYDTKSLKEIAELAELMAKNKDKVIFMDFWAPWCKPCVAELKKAKEVIARDYQEKEVAFVYLCSSRQKEKCTAIIEEYEVPGAHILLLSGEMAMINSRFNNTAIPFQILAYQDNVIRKGNQFRLDNPYTQRIITELLRVSK